MCEFFGFTVSYFDRDIRPLLSPDDVREDKQRKWFRGRAVADAFAQKIVEAQQRPDSGPDDSADPAKARLTLAQAKAAEVKLAQLVRELLPRDEVRDALAAAVYPLRNAGEKLQRLHGPKAFEILDQAVEALEKSVDDYFARLASESPKIGP